MMSSRLLLLAAALLLNQGVACAELPITPFANSNKCLQSQAGQNNGSPVIIADCDDSFDQLFTLLNGAITMYDGSMCLDVTNGVNNDGTLLQIWECYSGNVNQQWYWTDDSHVAWTNHGKCLDLTNGSQADGNQVQIWDCIGDNENQRWYLGYGSPPPEIPDNPTD